MAEPHPTDDSLLTLVLDDVPEPEREVLAEHLSVCSRCRQEYDDLSRTLEKTLAAAPHVQPSPGFDLRVLEAMGLVEPPRAAARRHRLGRWQVAAASVTVGMLVGGGATYLVNEYAGPAEQTTVAEKRAPLTTADGERVGTVARSWVDGEPVLVLDVTTGKVGMNYECRIVLHDGTIVRANDWTLESSNGATWVVKAPLDVVRVNLVAETGNVWSTAEL